MKDAIQIEQVSHSFGRSHVFDALNLTLRSGEVTALFGPNGCGKTTLIAMLAGIVRPDRGQITIPNSSSHPLRIGYVMQNYSDSLFPWQTVRQNLLYPLTLQRLPRAIAQQRLDQVISLVNWTVDLDHYPYQLSGGQQQLVAILRALIVMPDLLLLDEPFSSLDLEMTLAMRDRLTQICQEFRFTTVLVSHDMDDLVYLADRLVLLSQRPGQIVADLSVNLPHPRTPALLADPQFVAIKQDCLDHFRQEVRRCFD